MEMSLGAGEEEKTFSVSVEPCLWVSPAATKDMTAHARELTDLHTIISFLPSNFIHWGLFCFIENMREQGEEQT